MATLPSALQMGSRIAKADNTDRSPKEDCVFCNLVSGKGTRKIFEDDKVVAFHDIRPAAKVHLLVIPKQHIISTFQLQNTTADKELMHEMLETGKRLLHEIDPNAETTKFGFHDPGFISVWHLHLHCMILPHTNVLAKFTFPVTKTGFAGFVTMEQVLARLEKRAVGN